MARVSTNKKLITTIRLNVPEKFRMILEKEGWPKDIELSDYKLLIKAITFKRKKIVHIILDKGCRLFTKPGVQTPLHLAVAIIGWSNVVERLLDLGCKVGDQRGRRNGDTPLHLAFLNHAPGHIIDKILDIYLSESNANLANRNGLSFLHIACTRPRVHIVEKFIELNSTFINHPNLQLYTPLHFAVEYGQYEVAQFLLQRGANINKKDSNESTPLHIAIILKKASMIDLLLSYDKNTENVVNKFGLSHFMIACTGSNSDIVEAYLNAALESQVPTINLINSLIKNFGNYAGYTPLHFAADFGRVDTIELLLNYGADCCAVTLRGLTVHNLAEERNRDSACELLQEHCDVLTRCRELRAESPDFEKWGDNYERALLIERAMTLKQLRKTLNSVTTMSCSSEIVTSTCDHDDNCDLDLWSEFVI